MKLLRKLTIKNLLMNKSRTIVSIIGIMLSVALITTVAGIVSSMDASSIYTSLVNSGDYDIFFVGENFNADNIRTVKANRNVKDVYAFEPIRTYKIDDPKYQFVKLFTLYGTTSNSIDASCSQLKSGRFAENENEIVISESMNRYSKHEYKVGDTLSAEYGKRVLKANVPGFEIFYQEFGGRVIPDYIAGSFGDMEDWEKEGIKEFKIVGILKEEVGFLATEGYSYSKFFTESVKVYTYKEPEKSFYMIVNLWDDAEKDYAQVLSQITGCDENDIKRYLSNYADANTDSGAVIHKQLENNPLGIFDFGINRDLLQAKGAIQDDNSGGFQITSIMVMIVGMLIVMLASIFIIRNGFEISITEKTRLYGMLSSVGATPRQIKQNVFYEAFLLGIIGIPLGVLLGIGITAALVAFASSVLADQLGSFKLIFVVNVPAVILAVAVGIVTIACSAATSAKRASRTSPMEAIRSNKNVNISAKQQKKGYATPNWVKKIFGIGGSIAWKNMKRSRKQYRTTVISIVVSVALFLAINSTVDFAMRSLMNQEYYAIANSEYNVILYFNPRDEKGDPAPIPKGTEEQYFESIASGLGISKYRVYYTSEKFTFSVNEDQLCDEVKPDSPLYSRMSQDFVDDNKVRYSFMAVDKHTFMDLCDEAGLKYEDCKDKGFIWNYNIIDVDENNYNLPKPEKTQLFKDPVGMVLKGECTITEEVYDESVEGDAYYEQEPQYVDHDYNAEIEIAATVETVPSSRMFSSYYESKVIIVTTDRFDTIIQNPSNGTMEAYSADPNSLEDRIEECIMEGTTDVSGITNYSRMVNSMKSSFLVMQVFVYGFIVVISLIGITNLFNTVTTNMKLRQKEFAMLRSIGTTKKELHRMILLESALYTFKSLIIGIPIGVLGGFLLSNSMNVSMNSNGMNEITYQIPWLQMLMCLLVVLLLLFVIMRFSIAKFNKQNIIETIRNDNI